MLWEGPAAVEECSDEEPNALKPAGKKSSSGKPKQRSPMFPLSESEGDPSSEDEYIAEGSKSKSRIGKRTTRRVSTSSESDSEMSDDNSRARLKKSPAANSGRLKRKSHEPSHTPPPKRKKSAESSATDDPARKYCLGKLEELFRDIFLRYPHLRTENDNGGDSNPVHGSVVQKAPGDSTEEEKTVLVDRSKQFAADLESCIYETYSEPDKQGKHSAGPKYKDRFRTLQFNLSKADRIIIHQRIASGLLAPKEISTMSSTDLANEETKQSIRIAEKEALEHSILTPTTVPRAKITHKGLEDIEDIHGETARSSLDQERARIEEEERRERERMARLTVQRQRTASVSVPPESPVMHHAWGAPPPVPAHAMSMSMSPTDEAGPSNPPYPNDRSTVNSSYVHSTTETSVPESELNLADFINMDDEVPSAVDAGTKDSVASPPSGSPMVEDSPLPAATQTSATSSTTGISPFAARPESPRTSFNLAALWNAPNNEAPPPPPEKEEQQVPSKVTIVASDEITGADDQDFDMFLVEKDQGTSADELQAAFDALPQVWSGKITMPLDSTIPQETPVVARQLGGRQLEHHSPLWKTLFPADLLRIDGRVPIDNSNKFLLHMRMNTTKELIAVAFSPTSESSDVGFRILSDVLIAKGRHGLVFPWGHHPKDHHPGRELYIIPLLSSDPLPDFIELMDNLSLPKVRKVNYLIGIWVLTKGKLAPPPAPPPPAAVPQIPPNLLPLLNPGASLPAGAAQNPQPPLPAAIAAEVATLTPEQIQLMIQTLAGSSFPSVPVPTPQQSQALAPQPQPHVPITQPVPPQPWPNTTQSYGGHYRPSTSQLHHSPPHPQPHHERDFRPGGYDRGDSSSGRGDRGWRGRGRGSGRGHESPRKPVDSGWPRRRPQDDGGAGPPAPPSPRRW